MFLSFKSIYVPKIKVRYSSINEILTIKEYWNLIGQELDWEPDFPQACSFCRMFMNHKNFCFTQIPDKTNDSIFLKSPKTLFLGLFWPFLVIFAWWEFFQKIWVSQFQKKLMSQFWENLQTDWRTDGRTDGPYFIGPFRPRPGVQKGVMGLQVRAFKNCNKWTPEYKDYWRWKSLYFE